VKKNLTHAIKLLCKAARKEYALAQYELGWIYMNGRHGERDLALAAAWFQQAASNGDRHAKQLLRFMGSRDSQIKTQCLLPDGSVFTDQIAYPEPKHNTPNPEIKKIRAWVKQLAPKYGLQPRLVLEVIRAESNFDAKARSAKNACGLMQLIPATAKRFGVTDIWDPVENLKGGMAYLQWLNNYFKGDLRLTLAAYNAGEAAVVDHQGIPPYAETRRYVSSITRRMARAQRAL
jgi:membrane-bound lytic murein transglycosylase MltF